MGKSTYEMVVKCKLVWQQKMNIELIIAFELRVH